MVLGSGNELLPADLPVVLRASDPVLREGELNLEKVEEAMIRKALAECADNRTLAAKKLGISRRTLHRHLAQLGISKKEHLT